MTEFLKPIISDTPEELSKIASDITGFLSINFYIRLLYNYYLFNIEDCICYFRAVKCFDYLKEKGAKFDSSNCYIAGAAGGSIEILKRLNITDKLTNTFKVGSYHHTIPGIAATFGNLETLMYIFSFIKLDIDKKSFLEITGNALSNGHMSCVNFMLGLVRPSSLCFDDVYSLAKRASEYGNEMTLFYLIRKFTKPCQKNAIIEFIIVRDYSKLFIMVNGRKEVSKRNTELIVEYKAHNIVASLEENGIELPIVIDEEEDKIDDMDEEEDTSARRSKRRRGK